MSQSQNKNRPLSPYMIGPYYRPQLNSMTSIVTRISGVSLILASVLVVWWFAALAIGPSAFAQADAILTSTLGSLVLIGSVWALWYHLLAGMRHLIWDRGLALEMATADALSWGIIVGSVVLTIATISLV